MYTIRAGGDVIGSCAFDQFDDGLAVAAGAFQPAPGYARVRSIFRRFAEAVADAPRTPVDEAEVARYYRERDALQLELLDTHGRVIPTGFIHIVDFTEEVAASASEAQVQIADRDAWDAVQASRPTG